MPDPIILPAPRRWPFFVLGAAAGVAIAAAAFVFLTLDPDQEATTSSDTLTLTSAPVEVRDLVEEVDWIADLSYGSAVPVYAPSDGTVTAASDVGTVLRRGDVVVEIDNQPVSVIYGSVPAWRDLNEEDEGPDVLQLETNLVALGFDTEGQVEVDELFDSDTADMVEAWQESVGREATGVFAADSVVVVDGPVAVTSAPDVGTPVRAGETLAEVSARSVATTSLSPATGTVTDLAPPGTALGHGTLLFRVDDIEVRSATGLEPVAGIDTSDGIERQFVLVSGDEQIATWLVAEGDEVSESAPILDFARQTMSVVVPVELAARDDWDADQAVEILLPDETVVAGTVEEIGTVAEGTGQGQTPTIDVTIRVLDLVPDDLPASEVTVTVAGESVLGATVVPTRALLTLAEGGFAVERVLDDGSTQLVGVTTGTFDDGVVELVDPTLNVGDLVVVPS